MNGIRRWAKVRRAIATGATARPRLTRGLIIAALGPAIGIGLGLVHCLDAKTGKVHWTHDMLAAVWGSPLIVEGKIYIGNEDGDLAVFALSAQRSSWPRTTWAAPSTAPPWSPTTPSPSPPANT